MVTTPVRSYRRPRYPTRGILDSRPELLRLVPKRWRGNRAVLTAVAAACAIVSARWGLAEETPAPFRVAPIFTHGEGLGTFGCMATNPPLFLSEADAREVITQEAKAAGISLKAPGPTLDGVTVMGALGRDEAGRPKVVRVPVTLDLADKARGIAIEYVSGDEARRWDIAAGSGRASTVYTVNSQETARVLRWRMQAAHPSGTYGVLYDPMARPNFAAQAAAEDVGRDAKEKAQAELRAQMRDFIAWLKAQGIL